LEPSTALAREKASGLALRLTNAYIAGDVWPTRDTRVAARWQSAPSAPAGETDAEVSVSSLVSRGPRPGEQRSAHVARGPQGLRGGGRSVRDRHGGRSHTRGGLELCRPPG